tara:strand:- start:42781 stop:43416 length:636 start_codon:yes stop_codon:yes gene_type:complete
MKKVGIILYLLLFVPFTIYAQIGINTINPQEALDVNGKIRVTDTDIGVGRTMVSIIGIDDNETLSKINLSTDFVITNNEITVSGTTSYSVLDIDFNNLPPEIVYTPGVDMANLDLGVNNINAHETVIRFINAPEAFYISGVQGGVAGRHILLLNPSSMHMGVRDQDYGSNLSANEHRILTYGAGTTDATQGQGAIELVYDGFRWIVLNIRN